MTAIQACMTAAVVIKDMKRVLDMRHKQKITRAKFLAIWTVLRNHLSASDEYQDFRRVVWERDLGVCQGCGARTRTVHHRNPVARAPELAVTPSNGELRCDDCHVKKHPHMRRK